MRRFVLAVLAIFCAVAAFAGEPLMVRMSVFLRVPPITSEDSPPPKAPDAVLAAPAGGWPSSHDALREAISARRKRTSVFFADLETPKPLTPDNGAAFFIPDLSRPVQVKPNGDVLLPNGKHATMPVAAGSTTVLGADDEQLYVALTFLEPDDVHEDTLVIYHGQKPLSLVSRVDAKVPPVESLHNQSGIVLTQLRIEPDGSVSNVSVLRRVQPQIDAAVIDAFKQWRFQPPTRDGKPVTAYMVMSMNYRIE